MQLQTNAPARALRPGELPVTSIPSAPVPGQPAIHNNPALPPSASVPPLSAAPTPAAPESLTRAPTVQPPQKQAPVGPPSFAPALASPATSRFWADKPALAGKTFIYGGSFNPPHIGHQLTCKYLLEGMGAKEVWMMPVYKHADKPNLAAFGARVGMCQLLASNVGPGVHVTTVESKAPPTGSSYDAIKYVCAEFPDKDFAFTLGSDLIESAPTWGDFDLLTKLVPIALVPRPGYPVGEETAPELREVSSSEVLRRVASGEPVGELLTQNVIDYIREHHLYEELSAA